MGVPLHHETQALNTGFKPSLPAVKKGHMTTSPPGTHWGSMEEVLQAQNGVRVVGEV